MNYLKIKKYLSYFKLFRNYNSKYDINSKLTKPKIEKFIRGADFILIYSIFIQQTARLKFNNF